MPRAGTVGKRNRLEIGSVAGKVAKHNTTFWRVPMFVEKRVIRVRRPNIMFETQKSQRRCGTTAGAQQHMLAPTIFR